MNKKQILASLNNVANSLDNSGLYKEAIVLTNVMKRMADVVEPLDQEEPDYYYEIQKYAENVGKNKELAKSIYDEYVKSMTDLIDIQNNPNKRDLEKRLQAFKLQVAKLNTHEKRMPNYNYNIGLRNDDLAEQINYYGLERAKDLNDFNRRWKLYMDYTKRTRFKNDPPNGRPIYNLPGMQQYFANLYEQLKLKYIK
jgi:hypothetical protein